MTDALTGLRSIPSMSSADMSRWTEYGWLEERIKTLRAELAEIVKGYGSAGGDENIENGIGNLEASIDDFGRRMSRLDEGDA